MCSQCWIFKLARSNYKGVRSFCALVVAYIKDLVSIQYPSLVAEARASSKRTNTKTSSYSLMVTATWEKNKKQTAFCASVCAVANCRQHRAAENRLRHTVLHENPSFSVSWSFFVLHKCQLHNSLWHANQIRRGHGRSPIPLSLVRFQIHKNRERAGTARLCVHFAVSMSY